jgi:hypothetical protein
MTLSNQQKQERFRKKEYLKKIAHKLFVDWQLKNGLNVTKNPKAVKEQLDNIVDLPSNWTEDDYENALRSIKLFSDELYSSNPNLLDNDIESGRDSVEPYISAVDAQKWLRECKNAKYQAKKLIEHLNSAFALTELTASDKAAVVAELARTYGLNILHEKKTPCSDAVTLCLFAANPYHKKPDCFTEKFAELIKTQLKKDQIKDLIKKLK